MRNIHRFTEYAKGLLIGYALFYIHSRIVAFPSILWWAVTGTSFFYIAAVLFVNHGFEIVKFPDAMNNIFALSVVWSTYVVFDYGIGTLLFHLAPGTLITAIFPIYMMMVLTDTISYAVRQTPPREN